MKIRFFFFVIVFLIWPIFGWAESQVVINEIAWMGTENSANDEWIELYNSADQEIDLTEWVLKAVDGTPEIALTGLIPAQGYFLLERTDDSSVPEITADQIYTGALANAGENLELYDAENNLIDSVNCSDEWFAGNNSTKQTMERKNPAMAGNEPSNWQNSQESGGTPKAENSSGEITEELKEPEEAAEVTTMAPTPINQPPQAVAGPDVVALTNTEIVFDGSNSADPENDPLTYFWNFGDGTTAEQIKVSHIYQYAGTYLVTLTVSDGQNSSTDIIKVSIYSQAIVISEFLPSPKGPDQENEWIEIQNQSDQIADLSGWQLKDADSKSGFTFPDHSLIEAQSYLVLKRQTTKIALNNDQDTLSLFYPTGQLAQEIRYKKAQEGHSVNLVAAHQYVWSATPSPGLPNLITTKKETTSQAEILEKLSQVEETEETDSVFNLARFASLAAWPEKESNLLNLLPRPILAQVTQPSVEQISERIIQSLEEKADIQKKPSRQRKVSRSTALVRTGGNKPEVILILTLVISSGLFGLWLVQIKKRLRKS